MEEYIKVGISLFSRGAAAQVSSAPLSLTSVFGMGTGVPSTSAVPTVYIYIQVTRGGIEPPLPA